MAYRSEIERALDEMISEETGKKFQGIAVVHAKQKWPQLVACERNWDGGLDAYASGELDREGKGVGLACSITATPSKVEKDATDAKKNYPDLRVLIFSTPKEVTQYTAKIWTKDVHEKFGLQLIVVPGEEFITWLMEPANADICRDQLGIAPSMTPELAPAYERAREAANDVADNWDRMVRRTDRPLISLIAFKLNEKDEVIETVTTASLNTVLSEGQRIVLEAPAGSGKTTTLVQVARDVLDAGGLAFLVDLPDWVRSGKGVLSYVASRPPFASRDLDAKELSKLRGPRPPIFLLNGWNEVPIAGAEEADVAVRELDRSFGAAIVVVATRRHSLVPQLRGSFRLELRPLGRPQRDEYLRLALGDSEHDLRVKLNNSRVLDSITRTPLFLAEVVDLYRSGKDIPPTKMGVLGGVMDAIEQSPEHQTALRQAPLRGRAGDYLRALSMEMTGRGETSIVEANARGVVSSVSERLLAAKQIAEVPHPGDILDELSKRHVLVRAKDGEISFRFQHQQFQEFFAARGLRAHLNDLVREKDPHEDRNFLVSYVNEPRWGESLRLLAEDIGASGGDKIMVEVGAKLVRMALEVDLIFAGELARCCGPAVWSEVREEMGGRFRLWHDVPDARHNQCALAAMLATGSEDFKDIVVPLMKNPTDQILAVYHSDAGLLPSSLGPRWVEVVQGWAEDARLNFILQLANDPWLADTVEQLALADSSPQIKWNAARALSWYGFTEKVEKLLSPLGDGDFLTALHSLDTDEIPASLRQRAIDVAEAKYAETSDHFERLQTLHFLRKLGAKQIAERMKAELDGLDKKQLEAGNAGPTKWAMDELRESDPQWVSEWLARKFLEGSTRFGGWNEMVTQIPAAERDRLLERFTNELLDANEKQRVLSILATTADEGLVARLFESACELHRELMIGPSRDMAKWNFFRQQQDLLQAIAPKIILDALSPKLERDPEVTEFGLLTDVLGRLSPTRTDTETALPDEARQKLHAYLKRAVERAADPNGLPASVRAHLAFLLAQVGGPSDIPDLRRLVTADSIRYRDMRAAWLKGDRSGDNVGYVVLYMSAVMAADPEHGDQVLLEMLSEEQYERFVAEELVRRAKKSKAQPTLGIRPPAFEKVWVAREGKETEEYVEERRSRYADALRALIEKILVERAAATDKRPSEYRLKPIGASLAALDARRSAKLILEVMAFPAGYDAYSRVDSVQSLIFAGVRMTLPEMMNVLGPAIEQARRDLGNSDQNRWLMDRCLSVLPFVDPPEEGIAKIKEILAGLRFFYPHDSRGVVAALGASRCADAMDLLLQLAKPDRSAVAQIGDEWIKAVAQLGGKRSNEVLLSFVDPNQKLFTKEFVPDYQHGNVLARLLADRAEHDSEFKAELLRLASGELPQTKRMLLAKTFSFFQREDDLVAGLCVLRDDESALPFELLQSIENAFLERRPYGPDGHAYALAPRGSNALRKRLLEMAQTDPLRKHSAFALLGQIEVWRLEHGRPMDEPRHPAIESGAYWPI
jgi:hypothetical protein